MKEYKFSGEITLHYRGSFRGCCLKQPDGLLLDLIYRCTELYESFGAGKVKVAIRYFISDKPLTWDQAEEIWIKKILGNYLDSEYSVNEGCPTCGPDYDTEFKLGGHDLSTEIFNEPNMGKYLNFSISFIGKELT